MSATADPLFETLIVDDRESLRILLKGELDLATVPAARDQIVAALASCPQLILDLDSLSFIDSSGIRLIIDTDRIARAQNCTLTITPGSDAVRRAFDLTGLNEALPFER